MQSDILDVLSAKHAEADELFDRLADAPASRRVELFFELMDNLAIQSCIEEKLIFPKVADYGITKMLDDSMRAHAAIKSSMTDMLALDPRIDGEEFDALLYLLRLQVAGHVADDEERVLFPALRQLLSDETRAELAREAREMLEPVALAA